MADLNPIPFGGLAALDDPHLLTIQQGLTVQDCYLDNNAITGRNGYRSALPGAVTNSGTPQHLGRYRPSAASQRFVVVIGGNIYIVQGPTSETASDGIATLIGTGTFGATDEVCGAQLDENYYLVNNQTPATAIRINSGYTIEALVGLPQPAIPSFSQSVLDLIYLNSLTAAYSGITSGSSGVTNWEELSGTTGSTAQYDLTSGGGPAGGYAWQYTQWLMVTCSPETLSGGGTNFQVSLTDTSANVYPLGTISDPPNTNGSPWVVFFNLSGLGIVDNIKYLTFTQGVKASGSGADPFCVSAFMAFPTAPEPGTVDYYVTYYNSVTGVESPLSTAVPIIYNSTGVTFEATQAGRWNYNTFQNIGVRSTNPDTMTNSDMFNKGDGLAYPKSTDFAPVYTFSGTIPTAAQFPNADTVRLYRSTPVGISLVGSSIYTTRADGSAWTTGTGTASDLPQNYTFQTAGGTAWSITDNTGSSASANLTYVAGGPFPPATQMSAYAGRLCIINENQVSFSSFTPVGVDTNPVPQWPPIAIEADDGWSYDVSPAPTEVGMAIDGTGDAVYIGTSEMVRSMSDVTPNSPPFVILRRGVIGPSAYGFFETSFFWAAFDGIYMAQNQSGWVELSQEIRTYYMDVFKPSSATVVAYQNRKLYVFDCKKFIRFDFVKKRWSTGTLANIVDRAISFNGQGVADSSCTPPTGFAILVLSGGSLLVSAGIVSGPTGLSGAYIAGNVGMGSGGFFDASGSTLAGNLTFVDDFATVTNDDDYNTAQGFAQIGELEFGDPGSIVANALSAAISQSATIAALSPTQTFAAVNLTPGQTKTITGVSGINVININGDVNIDDGQLIFAGPSDAVFYVNISGEVNIDGGIAVSGYPVAVSSVNPFNVLLNMTGSGEQFDLTGPALVQASVLNVIGSSQIVVNNGAIEGQMVANTFNLNGFQILYSPLSTTPEEDLYILTDDGSLARWQASCTEDMQIGATPNSGAAIPAWVFSTGFQAAVPSPNTVIGLQLDASGPVSVQIAKVADAIVPTSARNLFTTDQPGIDECWFPGCPDFRGFKMRFQFTAQNSVTLRRANYEGLLLPGTKGG